MLNLLDISDRDDLAEHLRPILYGYSGLPLCQQLAVLVTAAAVGDLLRPDEQPLCSVAEFYRAAERVLEDMEDDHD